MSNMETIAAQLRITGQIEKQPGQRNRGCKTQQSKQDILLGALPGDLLAADLRYALRALGEILGETTPEEILEGIFDTFCVGK